MTFYTDSFTFYHSGRQNLTMQKYCATFIPVGSTGKPPVLGAQKEDAAWNWRVE